MLIEVEFTDAEVMWLQDYAGDNETPAETVKGMVMMVLADLDAVRRIVERTAEVRHA